MGRLPVVVWNSGVSILSSESSLYRIATGLCCVVRVVRLRRSTAAGQSETIPTPNISYARVERTLLNTYILASNVAIPFFP